MSTIRQELYDALLKENILYAHLLFIALQKGILKATDSREMINMSKIPLDDVHQAAEKNILGIQVTRLYACKRSFRNEHALYLTADLESALSKHRELFNEEPAGFTDLTEKKSICIVGEDEPLKNAKSFYELQKGVKLPHFVCVMDANFMEYCI